MHKNSTCYGFSPCNRCCFSLTKWQTRVIAQYYNYFETTEHKFAVHKKILDDYSDIPLDGFALDEYGFVPLDSSKIDTGIVEPFRARIYSHGMQEYYQDRCMDLHKLLFDMRYAPEDDEKVRIRAINVYFETLREFPLAIEKCIAEYAKSLYGDDIYMSCHNTFHNNLDNDEVWHTACNWWDLPRNWGHTDEDICYPVKMGVMLSCKKPLMFDMYYSKKPEDHYKHIIQDAPFNCREFHHAFDDFFWGRSFTEPDFLENIKTLDENIKRLNDFQCQYPKMDLLIVYGSAAQNNWYPDYESRNQWDIDGSLKILPICKEIWNAGYRCALVPDYAIEDGRITLEEDKICFNGHPFTHCLFLYPKYAKRETYEFLNLAGESGVKIAAVGRADIDFDGNPAALKIPCYAEYGLAILESLGCQKSAIPNGCIYHDGSFSLVSHGILTGEAEKFDFEIDGVRYAGHHTGLLAYRKGKLAFAAEGSEIWIDEEEIE